MPHASGSPSGASVLAAGPTGRASNCWPRRSSSAPSLGRAPQRVFFGGDRLPPSNCSVFVFCLRLPPINVVFRLLRINDFLQATSNQQVFLRLPPINVFFRLPPINDVLRLPPIKVVFRLPPINVRFLRLSPINVVFRLPPIKRCF